MLTMLRMLTMFEDVEVICIKRARSLVWNALESKGYLTGYPISSITRDKLAFLCHLPHATSDSRARCNLGHLLSNFRGQCWPANLLDGADDQRLKVSHPDFRWDSLLGIHIVSPVEKFGYPYCYNVQAVVT